jgi:hypothetical protein
MTARQTHRQLSSDRRRVVHRRGCPQRRRRCARRLGCSSGCILRARPLAGPLLVSVPHLSRAVRYAAAPASGSSAARVRSCAAACAASTRARCATLCSNAGCRHLQRAQPQHAPGRSALKVRCADRMRHASSLVTWKCASQAASAQRDA